MLGDIRQQHNVVKEQGWVPWSSGIVEASDVIEVKALLGSSITHVSVTALGIEIL
jgi:hypothetical protein